MPTGHEMNGIRKAQIFAVCVVIAICFLTMAGLLGSLSIRLVTTAADTSGTIGMQRIHVGEAMHLTHIVFNFLAFASMLFGFIFGSVSHFVRCRSRWSTGSTGVIR